MISTLDFGDSTQKRNTNFVSFTPRLQPGAQKASLALTVLTVYKINLEQTVKTVETVHNFEGKL
jgi:hypothetical protein